MRKTSTNNQLNEFSLASNPTCNCLY